MPTESLIVLGSAIVNNPQGYSYDARGDASNGLAWTDGEVPLVSPNLVAFFLDDDASNCAYSSDSFAKGPPTSAVAGAAMTGAVAQASYIADHARFHSQHSAPRTQHPCASSKTLNFLRRSP